MTRALAVSAALAAAVLWASPVSVPGALAQDEETVERLFFEAEEQERQGDLEGALRGYELLVERFPEAPAAAEAWLRLVAGYRALDRGREAEAAALALTAGHPRSPQAAGGWVHLGELLSERAASREALEQAREKLQSAALLFPRSSFPRLPWRSAGAVQAAALGLELGLDGEAAAALVEVIDFEAPSPWTSRARLELAGLLLDQDRWREAGELLQEVVDRTEGAEGEERAAALARARLALIDRLWLRPASGGPRWQRSRSPGGAPDKPEGVAAHDDGRVAVVGAGGGVAVFDAGSSVVKRREVEAPARASWLEDQLLVASKERAYVLLPERGRRSFAAPPSEKKPTLMPLVAVERAVLGGFFVLAAKPERLFLFDSGQRRSELLVGGKGREPVDLARDRRGRLLVLDRKAATVTRLERDGTGPQRLISGGWRQPQALTVDAAGNVYVLDGGAARIELFDRDGRRLDSLGPVLPGGVELRRPADLTVDAAGRLWIADARAGLVVLE